MLFGTTVGAGIFALPYIFIKAGFWLSLFYLALLGAVMLLVNLIYGEIVLRTQESHRLPGYTKKYLNRFGEYSVFILETLGIYGTLLVYVILGGQFLFLVFQSAFGGFHALYVFLFWLIFSAGVLKGLKLIGSLELLMSILLVGTLLLVVVVGLPSFKIDNLTAVDWGNLFLPYGVFLFALSGAIAIPEMKEELWPQTKLLKPAIITGTLLTIAVSAIFGVIVAGISGASTTIGALGGLRNILGDNFVKLVAVFGFLSIATSFLIVGVYLKDVFQFDFAVNKRAAGLLVVLVPILAFSFGLQSFVNIIEFLGSVTVALSALILLLIFKAAKSKNNREPEYKLNLNSSVLVVLAVIFLIGFIQQVIF